jgi:hypothetical protein
VQLLLARLRRDHHGLRHGTTPSNISSSGSITASLTLLIFGEAGTIPQIVTSRGEQEKRISILQWQNELELHSAILRTDD